MRTSLFAGIVAIALVIAARFPDRVHAGPVEQLEQLILHPSDPDVMVLRYTYGGDGLFFTDDGGETWKLACRSAIGDLSRGGSAHMTGDGHTLLGVFDGLFEDAGGGCGWNGVAAVGDKWVTDIVGHPSDPEVAFLITSTNMAGVTNGVVRRDADGSYTELGEQDEVLLTRLRVTTNGDALRFYQSAIRGNIPATIGGVETQVSNYMIRVSDDDAETFREFPFGPTESPFRLLAVDPTNPDRVVALLDHPEADDDVLVSTDQGETFAAFLQVSEFGAIAFAPDGRVWIGEKGASTDPSASVGLWFAASLDDAATKIGEYPVQCLGYRAESDTLFACQRWWFGTVHPTEGTFTETFRLTDVDDFVSCDGVDMAEACEAQLCRDYCGFGHFAQAPVCAAYTTPFCGVCVAAMEADEVVAECESGGGGSSGSGPTAGTSGGGAGQAGSGAAPDGGAGRAGAAANSGKGDSGCSYAGGPDRSAGRGAWQATAMFVAIFLLRRRRKRN